MSTESHLGSQDPPIVLVMPCPPRHRFEFGYSRVALRQDARGMFLLERYRTPRVEGVRRIRISDDEASIYTGSPRRPHGRRAKEARIAV